MRRCIKGDNPGPKKDSDKDVSREIIIFRTAVTFVI